ncbi:hypothetical protein ACLMJK_001442 [Lecanora helva]
MCYRFLNSLTTFWLRHMKMLLFIFLITSSILYAYLTLDDDTFRDLIGFLSTCVVLLPICYGVFLISRQLWRFFSSRRDSNKTDTSLQPKKHKSRPAPLIFTPQTRSQSPNNATNNAPTAVDIEAQHPYRNPFSPSLSPASSSPTSSAAAGSDVTATDTTMGIDEELEAFSPARARALRYGAGFGDVTASLDEGVSGNGTGNGHKRESGDSLGLGRYFFSNGVGIKRYESGGKGRGWKSE